VTAVAHPEDHRDRHVEPHEHHLSAARLIRQAAAGCEERQLRHSTQDQHAQEHRQDHLAEVTSEGALAAATDGDGVHVECC
jgi:hypothetical protein